LDTGRGPVATAIIKEGSLKVGMEVATSTASGKVKALFDFNGKPIKQADPSTPVEIMGLSQVPQAGEILEEKNNLKDSVPAEASISPKETPKASLQKDVRLLNLVLKADTQGTLEAIRASLTKLEDEAHQVNFIHTGVGEVSESDLLLAAAGNALVFGFEVRVTNKVRTFAQDNNIAIKTYKIIYELLDDAQKALEGSLSEEEKKVKGRAEVLKIFKLPESGNVVLGCKVILGKLSQNDRVKLTREGSPTPLHVARVKQIHHIKEQVKLAPAGMECGVFLKPQFLEPKKGDQLEVV
jgi:translation initiation factor IF-2